jgi:hypothetical protein
MEPLAGMLFGVVAKPATSGAPQLCRTPAERRTPAPRRRDQLSLLKLYPHRRGL